MFDGLICLAFKRNFLMMPRVKCRKFEGMSLVVFTELGFYCPQADVYIDPLRKVSRAIVTHAHSDHARPMQAVKRCFQRWMITKNIDIVPM